MLTAPWQKPFRGQQINKSHPLAKGLVGAWVMNEGTGNTVFDLSGNGNPATNNGADWIPDGFDFNGSGGYLAINDGDFLDFEGATESFSVVFSFRPDNVLSHQALLYKMDANNDFWRIHIWNDNKITASLDAIDFSTSTGRFTTGNIYHIAVVFNKNKNGEIYVDGIQDGTPVALNNEVMNISYQSVLIGRAPGVEPYYFNGRMYYAYIYNRALSSDEVSNLYREPYAMFQQSISPAQLYYEAPVGGLSIPIAAYHYMHH